MSNEFAVRRVVLCLALALGLTTAASAANPSLTTLQTFTNGSPMNLNMNYSVYVNGTWAFDVDYNGGWAYSLRRNTTDGTLSYLNSVRLANDAGSGTGEIMATTYSGPQNIVYFCCFMSHSADNTGSKGIVYYRVDPTTGAFTLLGVVPCSLGYIADSGDPYRPWLFSAYDNTVYEIVLDQATGTPSIGTRKCVGAGMSPKSSTCTAVTTDRKFLYCLSSDNKVGYATINTDGSLTYQGYYDLAPTGLVDTRCIGVSYDGRYLYVMPGILSFPTTYGLVGIFQRNPATGALTYQESQPIPSNLLIGQLIFHRNNTSVFFMTIYYIGNQMSWITRDPATGRFTAIGTGISCSPDTGNNIVFAPDTGTLYGTAWYSQWLLVINTGLPASTAPDATPPAAIGDLAIPVPGEKSITLTWTAPGDDGTVGQASFYDLRYSTGPITAANWASATPAAGVPYPRSSGTAESFAVTGLTPSTTYYFAIKALDPAGNFSGLSNVPSATTTPLDVTAPNAITDLAAPSTSATTATLSWTAPADYGPGPTGPFACTSYDLRYSSSPITLANWASATRVTGLPTPRSPGAVETFVVSGLASGMGYYFAIRSSDADLNQSDVSNVVFASTSHETIPPAWVGDLLGRSSKTAKAVDLTWTATGNDGSVGTAASYDLRYSASPIAWNDGGASWAAATKVSGLPVPRSAGGKESFTVTNLAGGTWYYFAIKVIDDSLNASEVSNCAPARASVIGEMIVQNGQNGYGGCIDSGNRAGAATTNYGTSDRFYICGYADQGAVNVMRGIVKFDLTSIVSQLRAASGTVSKATLSLYAFDATSRKGSSGSYGVYPVSKSWTETGVTWNSTGSVAWTTPGGDFGAAADATSPKQAIASVWYPFDVTARVQAWVANTSTNYGWVARCSDENLHNQDLFYQANTASAAYRPKLLLSDVADPVPGDFNGDASVDVVDLLIFVDSFGTILGVDRAYDPQCDLNADGSVDVVDLLTFVGYWPQ